MQRHQLELWGPKGTDLLPIYRDLSPEQRELLIEQLARLILKQIHTKTDTTIPEESHSSESLVQSDTNHE